MRLMIILGSSRTKRRGDVVANWVRGSASADGRFEVDFVDLRELNMPFFDEPLSPFSMYDEGQDYTNPAGKAWAQRVGQAEGVLIVTPEHNHGYPGVLKNTLDWVGREWVDKPVAFVSYSTQMTGGARSVEQLRQVTNELGLVQVANGIYIPDVEKAFANGRPVYERNDDKLKKMFDEIIRLHTAFHKN